MDSKSGSFTGVTVRVRLQVPLNALINIQISFNLLKISVSKSLDRGAGVPRSSQCDRRIGCYR